MYYSIIARSLIECQSLGCCPSANREDCLQISKSKRSTGRVVVWKEACVNRSYTLEASFLGSSDGNHYNTKHLEAMGHEFCKGLLAHRKMHLAWMLA